MNTSMTAIRKAYPAMRRTEPFAIIHSGGRQTIFGCLCGARHTCSTEWRGRDSLHVAVWCREHVACADRIASAIAEGKPVEVSFGRSA